MMLLIPEVLPAPVAPAKPMKTRKSESCFLISSKRSSVRLRNGSLNIVHTKLGYPVHEFRTAGMVIASRTCRGLDDWGKIGADSVGVSEALTNSFLLDLKSPEGIAVVGSRLPGKPCVGCYRRVLVGRCLALGSDLGFFS